MFDKLELIIGHVKLWKVVRAGNESNSYTDSYSYLITSGIYRQRSIYSSQVSDKTSYREARKPDNNAEYKRAPNSCEHGAAGLDR